MFGRFYSYWIVMKTGEIMTNPDPGWSGSQVGVRLLFPVPTGSLIQVTKLFRWFGFTVVNETHEIVGSSRQMCLSGAPEFWLFESNLFESAPLIPLGTPNLRITVPEPQPLVKDITTWLRAEGIDADWKAIKGGFLLRAEILYHSILVVRQ
jgi:hypothetical protein